MYPEFIMNNVRENLGLEPDDKSKDDEISNMSKVEVLERYWEWEGISGFSSDMINVIEGIYDIIIDD